MNTLGLERLDGRCSYGYDLAAHHPDLCNCTVSDPWPLFVGVLRSKVRADDTVHVNDCRESLRGRIEPKRLASLWSEARRAGLLVHDGWEDSTDSRGRNDDKQARIWRATDELLMRSAA